MQLEHEFTVPVPPEEAWRVLLDVEKVAPCMPGATLGSFTGDAFDGKVKVKVGPITVTYSGQGTFVEKDESAGVVVIEASGKEVRGQGTAKANVRCQLNGEGGGTRVQVVTDLAVTGRPAQFGRGVMNDVGGKLIGRFASCLAEQLSGGSTTGSAGSATASEAAESGSSPSHRPTMEPDEGRSAQRLFAVPSQDGGSDAGSATPSDARSATPSATGRAERAPAAADATTTTAQPPRWQPPRTEAEPIDLLETAGMPVLKRAGPAVGVLVLLAVLTWWWRRRR